MRTTDSRSSLRSKRHSMSSGTRDHPCTDQNRSTASGSRWGGPAGTSSRTCCARRRCRPRTRRPRAVRPGRARGAPARSRVRRSRPSVRGPRRRSRRPPAAAARPPARPGRWPAACAAAGERDEVGVRLDAHDAVGVLGPAGEVEPGAAAEVEQVTARPVPDLPHGGLDAPLGVDAAVLQLVDRGVVPDVGAGDRPVEIADNAVRGGELRGHDARRAVRGDPVDLDVLERVGGVAEPLRTRAGSPAISSRSRCSLPLAPALGCWSAGDSHCTKNGSCGSDCRPVTPIWRHRSSTPSGRCRLPCADSRPSRDSTGAMSSTATTQPIQPPPSSDRARTAWPNGALSEAGWSRTSTTSR